MTRIERLRAVTDSVLRDPYGTKLSAFLAIGTEREAVDAEIERLRGALREAYAWIEGKGTK